MSEKKSEAEEYAASKSEGLGYVNWHLNMSETIEAFQAGERSKRVMTVINAAREAVKPMADGLGGFISDEFWSREELALRDALKAFDETEGAR